MRSDVPCTMRSLLRVMSQIQMCLCWGETTNRSVKADTLSPITTHDSPRLSNKSTNRTWLETFFHLTFFFSNQTPNEKGKTFCCQRLDASVVCHLEKLMTKFIKHKKVIKKKCYMKRFRLTFYHAQFFSIQFFFAVSLCVVVAFVWIKMYFRVSLHCCWCRQKIWFFIIIAQIFTLVLFFPTSLSLPSSSWTRWWKRRKRKKIKLSSNVVSVTRSCHLLDNSA